MASFSHLIDLVTPLRLIFIFDKTQKFREFLLHPYYSLVLLTLNFLLFVSDFIFFMLLSLGVLANSHSCHKTRVIKLIIMISFVPVVTIIKQLSRHILSMNAFNV